MCHTNFRIVKIYMTSMHELLRVLNLTYSENLNRKSKQYHLPSCTYVCQIIVSIVRMLAAAAQTLTLLVLLHVRRSHYSIQQLLELANAMATFSLCRIYPQTMTKNRPRLASLEAQQPAELASQNAWRFAPFIQECISMATLVCAHGTANLTNHGPSELVEERIFYSLQVRTRII